LAAFTLTTLSAAIDEWLENDFWGDTSQDQKNNIIVLAEEKINSTVSIASYNRKETNVSSVSQGISVATVDDSITGPLIPAFFKIRSGISDNTKPWKFLLLKDRNFLQEYAPVDSSQGEPKYYSFYNDVVNSNRITINFAPIPDAAYSYQFGYYFEPASITAGANDGTTWLSTHAKNALLYGCLVQAYIFMKGDPNLIQTYEMKFMEALQALVSMQGGEFRNNSYNDSDNTPNVTAAQ
jgi:hypothetical protein